MGLRGRSRADPTNLIWVIPAKGEPMRLAVRRTVAAVAVARRVVTAAAAATAAALAPAPATVKIALDWTPQRQLPGDLRRDLQRATSPSRGSGP